MSVAVFVSRILGLVRDQVMAFFFGGGWLNDAFNVAYNIPNLLRRLFGEGALSTAFVPLYNDIGIKKDRDAQIEYALNVISILTLFLLILTVMGIALAPLIVRLLYPGLNPATTRGCHQTNQDHLSLSILYRALQYLYSDSEFTRLLLYDRPVQCPTQYRYDRLCSCSLQSMGLNC